MSAFKSLTSQDVIIVPFVINKSFTFVGSASFVEPDVFIERLIGTNITGTFIPSIEPTTGTTGSNGYSSSYYQRDIYNSVKQLYYSNELPNPEGTYIVTDLNGNIVKKYNSLIEAKEFGFLSSCIQACCVKKIKIYKGFVFRYEKDPFSIEKFKIKSKHSEKSLNY
jgi:hypothetical protein